MALSDITTALNAATEQLTVQAQVLANIDGDITRLTVANSDLAAQVTALQNQIANGATPADLQVAADALAAKVAEVNTIAQQIDVRTA